MNNYLSNQNLAESDDELTFIRSILQNAPTIMSINELQISGDYLSVRKVWMNKRGLDFVGCTQEEITAKAYNFFDEFIHPDDLKVLPEKIKTIYASTSETLFEGMYRIKNRNQSNYCWLYCNYIVLSSFEDGSMRQMLVVGLDISDKIHSDNQLTVAFQEIIKQKFESNICKISKRERQVLDLIIKGKTDKQIANELYISISTAKKHRTNLLHKNNVHNSAELVAHNL